MKILVLFFYIFICINSYIYASTEQNDRGIGTRQAQGIGKGIILGSLLGGVIGNQKDKSVEGILIGGTVGAMLGSEIGKNKDHRIEKQKKARTENPLSSKVINFSNHQNYSYDHPSVCSSVHPNKDLINAKRAAEDAEQELRNLEARIREKERRERLITEYRFREQNARERILDLRSDDHLLR